MAVPCVAPSLCMCLLVQVAHLQSQLAEQRCSHDAALRDERRSHEAALRGEHRQQSHLLEQATSASSGLADAEREVSCCDTG